MRQAIGPVLAAAGEDARVALGEPREHAVAVVLHFVQPVAALRRLGDERGELRRDEGRQLDFLASVLGESALGARVVALHALRALRGDVVVAPHFLVVALYQQPRRAILLAARARQDPRAVELLALEAKMQPPLAQRRDWIRILRRPDALVPEEHLARAVLLFRDHAFELAVLKRMVFGLHGEALVAGIEARALRYRPALQHALELEAKVVMQPRRRVPLDVITQRLGFFRRRAPARRSPRGLRRDREIAHFTVALQPIGHVAGASKARARTVIATGGTQVLQRLRFSATSAHRWHGPCSVCRERKDKHGPGNRTTPAAAPHAHAAGPAGAEASADVGDGIRPGGGAGARRESVPRGKPGGADARAARRRDDGGRHRATRAGAGRGARARPGGLGRVERQRADAATAPARAADDLADGQPRPRARPDGHR